MADEQHLTTSAPRAAPTAGTDFKESIMSTNKAAATRKDVPEPLWYRVQVERKTLKQLQGRSNWQGLVYFGTYLALLALFATFTVIHVLPTWGRVASFVLFATVYCFSEAILHETNHRTAFRTPWLNETVHYAAGLLTFKEPFRDRWLHAAHHTYTSFPEIDPEVLLEPPPKFNSLVLDMFRVKIVLKTTWQTFYNAVKPDALTMRFVPPTEHKEIQRSARVCVAYYLAVIAASIAFHTWWPILFVFAARFVGAWLNAWIMFPQHAGLASNVADFRLDSRTILLNPINRFLVWNMNYHLEHHMYPTVPFHRLPALCGTVEHDCPPAYTSSFAAWREMIPALWQQKKDTSYFVLRPVPEKSSAQVQVPA
jgi:fatty acid desaturase